MRASKPVLPRLPQAEGPASQACRARRAPAPRGKASSIAEPTTLNTTTTTATCSSPARTLLHQPCTREGPSASSVWQTLGGLPPTCRARGPHTTVNTQPVSLGCRHCVQRAHSCYHHPTASDATAPTRAGPGCHSSTHHQPARQPAASTPHLPTTNTFTHCC
jgi:hypothetical protein